MLNHLQNIILTTRYQRSCGLARQVIVTCWILFAGAISDAHAQPPIDFSSQIRPILNRKCVTCHGGIKQAAGLSFIYRDQALEVIQPGDPDHSEMMIRILEQDQSLKMPPPDAHPQGLSEEETELIDRWIRQGATWSAHWAFKRPKSQPVPQIKLNQWPKKKLDHFVLAKLEAYGLSPAEEADPAQWLRRTSFDLTGLPPSIMQLEELENDIVNQPRRAYEKQVDRLLASPSFGERWAQVWLDLVRYADTMGYEADLPRKVWPYRDWLIRAFNDDMPFDQFTIAQIAGDLLPSASAADIVATACQRNTQTNVEGGTDDEEFRVAAVIDRVNTTWTVWQGLTFGCAQCHSHPYEPIEHHEYYCFLSFYNNSEDCDLKNEFPRFAYPLIPEQTEVLFDLQKQQREIRQSLNNDGLTLAEDEKIWKAPKLDALHSNHGTLVLDDGGRAKYQGDAANGIHHSVQFEAKSLSAIKVRVFPQSDDPKDWPERGAVISTLTLEIENETEVNRKIDKESKKETGNAGFQNVELSDVFADSLSGPYRPIEALSDAPEGFGGYPKLFKPRWAVFVLEEPIEQVRAVKLRLSIRCNAKTTGAHPTHVRVFSVETTSDPRWTQTVGRAARKALRRRLGDINQTISDIPNVMMPVMAERDHRAARPTRVFMRGNWMDKGKAVQPSFPKVFQHSKTAPTDRLDMARWLVSPENPLTARVLVNRVWAQLFGTGIVETLEDFGSSGQPPSHPNLLDDLALRFQGEMHYRLKTLLKEIVLSSTYRQANHLSSTTSSLAQADAGDVRNRLLGRGPRNRLSAEMVRDQALKVSGLLSKKMFGKPVMPFQPSGIWEGAFTGKGRKWEQSTGEDQYRRGVYTYWKRTAPYPSFVAFDAPSRDVCNPRRIATNTPLQALVTLNDPVYQEAAKALGKQMLDLGVAVGYRMVTSARLDEETAQELQKLKDEIQSTLENENFDENHPLGATPEEAALTVTAAAIMNLDSALTK